MLKLSSRECRIPRKSSPLAYLKSFAATLLACFALSAASHAQTTTTLVPSSYTTTKGADGGQAVATSIDLLDESGTTNTWSKYVEFQTTSSSDYAGYQTFTLPTTIAPASISSIQLAVNYQGPATSEQTWTWKLYDWTTSAYVKIGTNAAAPAWGAWTILTFNATGTLSDYVRASDGQMRVQLVSNNDADNVDIDYESLTIVSQSGTSSVSVSMSPTSAALSTSQTQQFTATVTGSSNTAVTWAVNGVTGGNSTIGTISANGLYTAPSAVPGPAGVTVTATSQADTTKSASAAVTISAQNNSGTIYYVAPGGLDTNPGTETLPWKTVQHSANVAEPGDTVYLRAGTYNELVTVNVSGNATAGPITFANYPGETSIIDGTGLTIPGGQNGLITIENQNYIIIQGLQIQNYTTTSKNKVPIGIYITGADSYIQILDNHIENIVTSASGCNANALGLAVYGTSANSINNLTIDHNELDDLTTGCSESMTINGNVQYWTVSNNLVHDNNNIGIDAIGYENIGGDLLGVMCGTDLCDRARDGDVIGNTVYNITSNSNPAYGSGSNNKSYGADGLYVDGGTRITIERNLVHNTDIGIEAASENPGNDSPGVEKADYITIRSNIVYNSNAVGITIGGYAKSGAGGGGSDHIDIVNNTLYGNDTSQQGAGEFQVQYHSTNNLFENNILYANSQALFVNSLYSTSPVTADYNLYYSASGAGSSNWTWLGTSKSTFAAYKTASGNDTDSLFADPQFVSTSTPDFHVASTSPAVNAGTNLGSVVEGQYDYAGNPRVQGAGIDIGAYEQ
jgi:hypothetical protein